MPAGTDDRTRLTPQERAAIAAASSPSASNAVLTRSAADALYEDALTADQRAAITGAAAPSGANVFATMADAGGASPITSATISSGSIAAGTDVNVDFANLPDRVVILALRIAITAGSCDAVQVKLYRGNPPGGTDLGNIIGPTANVNPSFDYLALGPQRYTNGYGFSGPVVTASGHLVAKVYNNSADAVTFDVTLSYLTLP